MKTMKKHLKSLAIVLGIIVLFQGCSAYKYNVMSLDQAALQGEYKAKLVTTNDSNLYYKRIESKDGQYYGVKKIKGEFVKELIDPNEIKTVSLSRSKNIHLSTPLIIGISIVTLGLAILFAPKKEKSEINIPWPEDLPD